MLSLPVKKATTESVLQSWDECGNVDDHGLLVAIVVGWMILVFARLCSLYRV